jgi:flagellar hook-associated protein 3 FlgL
MSTLYRVTERSIATNVLVGLQGNLTRLGETQTRLSNGKVISRPSDSPTGTVAAMQYRGDIAAAKQYSRNADDGAGWLGAADSALSNVVDGVQRARDLILQGMSSGTGGSQDARDALAVEVDSVRGDSIGLANATYLNRPVFGGTTNGAQAFSPAGAYAGDTGTVQRTVGDNLKVRVDTDGQAVFGTGNTQLFQVLADAANDLRTNPSALGGDLDRLDQAFHAVQAAHAGVGARYNQITDARQAADDHVIDLTKQLSDVEDVDLPKTITELQLQQTAYQAALAAGAKIVQPSLVDFLR